MKAKKNASSKRAASNDELGAYTESYLAIRTALILFLAGMNDESVEVRRRFSREIKIARKALAPNAVLSGAAKK